MSNIVRAWKDETYRQSLSSEEVAMLPANPAGEIELTDAELAAVTGAIGERTATLDSGYGHKREERERNSFDYDRYNNYKDAFKDATIWCIARDSDDNDEDGDD
jgi:mersacidin/lichenicidin family type 2 lantibiotic